MSIHERLGRVIISWRGFFQYGNDGERTRCGGGVYFVFMLSDHVLPSQAGQMGVRGEIMYLTACRSVLYWADGLFLFTNIDRLNRLFRVHLDN